MTASDGIDERIQALRRRDRRFARDAYDFVLEALDHTLVHLGKDRLTGEERHVGGRELLDGIREFGAQQFGPMAPLVFRRWGVRSTDDFGEIVFNLIDIGLLSRRADDSRLDFADAYDFDLAFAELFRDRLAHISRAV
ncbi:MAG: hypothetical protein IPM29_13145 [Planctomycetes bacterium]|nr:hypothetical protein [Planctomycetota bacterium]